MMIKLPQNILTPLWAVFSISSLLQYNPEVEKPSIGRSILGINRLAPQLAKHLAFVIMSPFAFIVRTSRIVLAVANGQVESSGHWPIGYPSDQSEYNTRVRDNARFSPYHGCMITRQTDSADEDRQMFWFSLHKLIAFRNVFQYFAYHLNEKFHDRSINANDGSLRPSNDKYSVTFSRDSTLNVGIRKLNDQTAYRFNW